MTKSSPAVDTAKSARWQTIRHLPIIFVLLGVVIVQYGSLALQNRVLVGYDTLTYFYPNEHYVSSTLASGKLPLWNPYLFTGVPFLANLQTAVFYPLNLIFLLAPAARAYALSVVLHVFLAGCFAYAFAVIAIRLRPLAGLAVATVFALSGFLGAQSGHLNQLQASAWLPAALLAADLAYRRRSARIALAGSLVFATQFLAGHTQEFYYSSLAVAALLAWRLYQDIVDARSRAAVTAIVRGTSVAASMLALAAGLIAIQFLPSYELAGESIRAGGMSYHEATSFSLPPWLLLRSLLPAYGDPQPFSEWIGYVGAAPLLMAVFAVLRGKRHPMTPFFLVLAVGGLALALGQFNPLYPLIHRLLPGLDLFRVPARWLLLYTFGMAGLTGVGMQHLIETKERAGKSIARILACISILAIFGAAFLLLTINSNPSGIVELPSLGTVAISAALVTASALTIVFARERRGLCAGSLLVVIAAELLLAGRTLDAGRVNLPEAVSSLRPAIAHLAAQPGLFRVLPFSEGTFDPGDLAEMKAMLDPLLEPGSVYDYVVATKHKETLTPNLPLLFRIPSLDGYDGGLLPLRSYVELKNALRLTKGTPDSRLREDLTSVPPVNVLSWLNVKYVLTDRVRDAWIDGVYYDLGLTRLISSDRSWETATPPAFQATSVGVISHLEQAQSLPDGAPVAQAVITLDSGTILTTTLRAGVDTAEGRYSIARPQHKQARQAKPWRGEPEAWDYVTLINLPKADGLRSVSFTGLAGAGAFALRGVSVIDERRSMSYPVPIDPAFKISHLGDVKIYENERALPRAFLVHQVIEVNTADDALAVLNQPGFDPTRQAVVIGDRDLFASGYSGEVNSDAVVITKYEPERIALSAETAEEGLLLLTDSYYPGWKAWLDGEPAEILRTDHLFRGVKVPAGKHNVEFRYEPETVRAGAAITLFTLAIVVGGLIVTTRKLR